MVGRPLSACVISCEGDVYKVVGTAGVNVGRLR